MMMRPSDLRGILNYVPRFRGRTFVLGVDSSVLVHENFRNLLLDISVLRSLNINVVLVHGCSERMKTLGPEMQIEASDYDGMGVTTEATLRLSLLAASELFHELLGGLKEVGLEAAMPNAVVAHPLGILHGKEQEMTGKVVKVDQEMLKHLIDRGIVPVLSPFGYDGHGHIFRVNSDAVALEVSEALVAAKLIYVTNDLPINDAGRLAAQFSVPDAEKYIKENKTTMGKPLISKLEHGVRACRNGVNRAHIIDGSMDEALLSEIFFNEGVGTMIHSNEYAAIRPAKKQDLRALMRLIEYAVEREELIARSIEELELQVEEFHVFEIDRNIVGCVHFHPYEEDGYEKTAELGCLVVSDGHANQGIGSKLVSYVENEARVDGFEKLLVCSTQAYNYFQSKAGYQGTSIEELPPSRRSLHESNGRNSRVLCKVL